MSKPGVTEPRYAIAVLAHNEERRIARCLNSLPLDDEHFAIHVAVNGSRDRTAAIVCEHAGRHRNLTLHDWAEPGKARTWNRLLLDTLAPGFSAVILVDGDAQVAPGSISALIAALEACPQARIASAPPLNGRRAEHYRTLMAKSHGVFGDLYALRGSFLDAMRSSGIRLPVDLVGDDGLVGALAKTDLGPLAQWCEDRVQPVLEAGFRCDPFALGDVSSWRMQYRRMINYAVRHYQDRIITVILREQGPQALPERLCALYAQHVPAFRPRRGMWWWFDQMALQRMAKAATAA